MVHPSTRTAADNYQCWPHALETVGTVSEVGSDAIKFDETDDKYLGGVLSSTKTLHLTSHSGFSALISFKHKQGGFYDQTMVSFQESITGFQLALQLDRISTNKYVAISTLK